MSEQQATSMALGAELDALKAQRSQRQHATAATDARIAALEEACRDAKEEASGVRARLMADLAVDVGGLCRWIGYEMATHLRSQSVSGLAPAPGDNDANAGSGADPDGKGGVAELENTATEMWTPKLDVLQPVQRAICDATTELRRAMRSSLRAAERARATQAARAQSALRQVEAAQQSGGQPTPPGSRESHKVLVMKLLRQHLRVLSRGPTIEQPNLHRLCHSILLITQRGLNHQCPPPGPIKSDPSTSPQSHS